MQWIMAPILLCRRRLTAMLLTSSTKQAGLNGYAHLSETDFIAQALATKPQFAILTHEYLEQAALFAELRQRSPHTHIVLCVLPNASAINDRLWPYLDTIEVDSICTLDELTDCLRSLVADGFYTSTLLATYTLSRAQELFPGWQELTQGERRILQKLAEGQTGPQIAETLFISPKTVNNHKAKIALKLNVCGGPGSLVKFSLLNRERLLALLQ
ncbi:helix-turn-helix domain-containing protein [Spirosoma pollinicola]|uniref:HTH luxR-type domain-containing protein n=1 Tax=Spirosoma pollinicola TaxID=2057025 RepID=A0A2K8Z4T2_9BACT|nr:LuxR C-terminal-related transcriptional regulator [Spirosoma pollinicola]AUD04907.1 hypothetical protein CWM47_25520 [Spirosoma pollinicola]